MKVALSCLEAMKVDFSACACIGAGQCSISVMCHAVSHCGMANFEMYIFFFCGHTLHIRKALTGGRSALSYDQRNRNNQLK